VPVSRDVKWAVQAPWWLSTGAKTAEGIEHIPQALTKHGRYSERARAERDQYRKVLQHCREVLVRLIGPKGITSV
jgi:hypothetical protein